MISSAAAFVGAVRVMIVPDAEKPQVPDAAPAASVSLFSRPVLVPCVRSTSPKPTDPSVNPLKVTVMVSLGSSTPETVMNVMAWFDSEPMSGLLKASLKYGSVAAIPSLSPNKKPAASKNPAIKNVIRFKGLGPVMA
jgi:hypothetical protein